MTAIRLLEPLQPLLSGRWWWAGALAAAVAAWLVLRETLPALRRSADARCRRCGHPFPPDARFDADPRARCSECGAEARSLRDAHVRPIRPWRLAASVSLLAAVVLPYALWHNVHLFLARQLLPRWVTTSRAELPGGLSVAHEVDPVQAWIGWQPNFADGAWDGGWGDPPPATAPGTFVWPDRARVRVSAADGGSVATNFLGPFVFGATAALPIGAMPPVGTPGFGGDLTDDGEPDVVIGEVLAGSGGGIEWFRVRLLDGVPSFAPVGSGVFRRGPAGEWLFDATCTGFRYRIAPGAFLQDPAFVEAWDPLAQAWLPDPDRMRAEPDAALLAKCVAEARGAWVECAGGGPAEPPGPPVGCPSAAVALSRGAIHLAFTGNGAAWEAWLRGALGDAGIPVAGAFAGNLVADLREALGWCSCADALRELNGADLAGPRP